MSLARSRAVLVAALMSLAGAPACSGGGEAPGSGPTARGVDGGGGPSRGSDCASCHMADFTSARGHVGQRPTACAVCHASDAWHPTGLHHDFWPLTGKHEKTRCFDCHAGEPPVFHGTDKACIACHRAEYEKAPNHAGRFPTTCEECHSTTAWKPLLPGHESHPAATPTATPVVPAPPPSARAPAHSPPALPVPPPRPASATPKPQPPRPTPTVEPTSHASKRL